MKGWNDAEGLGDRRGRGGLSQNAQFANYVKVKLKRRYGHSMFTQLAPPPHATSLVRSFHTAAAVGAVFTTHAHAHSTPSPRLLLAARRMLGASLPVDWRGALLLVSSGVLF